MKKSYKAYWFVAKFILISGLFCFVACQDAASHPRQGAQRVEKIVTLAPSLTEIVTHIGGADRIVGLSKFARIPPGAIHAKRIGGFVDPSIEMIIGLRPDLVVGVPLQKRSLESCSAANLKVIEINCGTVSQVLDAYRTLGKALDLEEQATKSRNALEGELNSIREKSQNSVPVRTLFLLGHSGQDLQSNFPVTPGNFGDELLTIAGGKNVLRHSAPSISTEAVISLAPEVIIEVAMDSEDQHELVETSMSPVWSRLDSVPAVKNRQVYKISNSSLLVPGPRMADGAKILYQLLHPSQPSSL